jgi:hypothetical protein
MEVSYGLCGPNFELKMHWETVADPRGGWVSNPTRMYVLETATGASFTLEETVWGINPLEKGKKVWMAREAGKDKRVVTVIQAEGLVGPEYLYYIQPAAGDIPLDKGLCTTPYSVRR